MSKKGPRLRGRYLEQHSVYTWGFCNYDFTSKEPTFPNPSPHLEKQLETEGRHKIYPHYEGLSSKRKPLGEPISVVSPQAGVPCNSRMIICLNSMKDPSFVEQIAYD